ncbi:MAG: IclR family transcriptional regulator C-terminal domain-containing protein, partial [Desulfocapsaceae bacterium]|nr:IclR family transcriptional regulator C-terminal domain-containing protein [Desulfocapsaceae bacterium]
GVFADKVESRDFGVKLFSEIGKTFPLYCTGMGKILMAFSPPDTFTELLKKPLKALTDKTITDPLHLRKELTVVKDQGYAVDNEEITRGIICVAGPVFDFNLELIGAISIAFPASLNHDRGIEPEIAAIKRYAALISQSLSGSQTAAFKEP